MRSPTTFHPSEKLLDTLPTMMCMCSACHLTVIVWMSSDIAFPVKRRLTLWKLLLTILFPEFSNLTSQTLEDEITNYLPPIRTTSGPIAYNDVNVLSMSSYGNCVNIIRYCVSSETKTLTMWKPVLTTLFPDIPEFSNLTSQTLEDEIITFRPSEQLLDALPTMLCMSSACHLTVIVWISSISCVSS